LKQLYGAFLFFVLIAPFGFPLVTMEYEQFQVRKIVKKKILQGIDKRDLTCLKFSTEEANSKLNWEHAKEFEYEHQMYDVVYLEILTDSVLYWCFKDEKETAIEYKLKQNIADVLGASSQNQNSKRKLIDFFKKVFQTTSYTWNIQLDVALFCFADYTVHKCDIYFTPPFSPPEVIKQT
jgi:hypothetical protein